MLGARNRLKWLLFTAPLARAFNLAKADLDSGDFETNIAIQQRRSVGWWYNNVNQQ